MTLDPVTQAREITREMVETAEWIDPRQRASAGTEIMGISVVRNSRATNAVRGSVSKSACKWFLDRGHDRIRWIVSGDGELCGLQPDPRGVMIQNPGHRSPTATVTLDIPAIFIGDFIELHPFPDLLIGNYPRAPYKEDSNGNA